MADSVIKVSNLSKRYRIGLKEKPPETLIGQLSSIILSPLKNLQSIRRLNRFGLEDDSVFWALKDVNFEVKEGEVLGIIGKNGAGKSTLLKILSQISEPTSGRIEIIGRVASLLEVGTGFHPELSGRDNIYMNGTILGLTRREIDIRLDEIIDFSGVEKFIDTPVKHYSSGMKVRLGFSVAAHLEPEILIIDEVLSVGDFEFQSKCLGKIKDVSKKGRTVLFVSHNLEAVKSLCERALLLEDGFNVHEGLPQDVIKYYLQKNQSFILRREWQFKDAPGNDCLRVKSISISSNNSQLIGILEREEDLIIKTEFWMEKDNISTNLSMILSTDSGEIILNSYSQVPLPKLNRGLYLSTCIIPGGLLNEGNFKISMLFVKDSTTVMFDLSEILVFELINTKKREIDWHGKFPGYFHPKLDFLIHV